MVISSGDSVTSVENTGEVELSKGVVNMPWCRLCKNDGENWCVCVREASWDMSLRKENWLASCDGGRWWAWVSEVVISSMSCLDILPDGSSDDTPAEVIDLDEPSEVVDPVEAR